MSKTLSFLIARRLKMSSRGEGDAQTTPLCLVLMNPLRVVVNTTTQILQVVVGNRAPHFAGVAAIQNQ